MKGKREVSEEVRNQRDDINRRFGLNLARLRLNKEKSQLEIAGELDIDVARYNRIESGKYPSLRHADAERYANYFGYRASDLSDPQFCLSDNEKLSK